MNSRCSIFAILIKAVALALPLAAITSGCAARTPRATSEPSLPADGNSELMEYIAEQPFVTANAAYRAIWLMLESEPYSGGFDDLTQALATRKVIDARWHYDALQFIDNATAAYMISRSAKFNSSINFALTGLGRYAWKELQYRRIAEPGSELSLITGGQFLGMLAKSDDYLHDVGRASGQRSELGDDPSANRPTSTPPDPGASQLP